MAGILRYVIIFLLSRVKVPALGANDVSEAFNKYRVVPDIIPVAPTALVKVSVPQSFHCFLSFNNNYIFMIKIL